MRPETLFRAGACVFISLALSWLVLSRDEQERGLDGSSRYSPYIHGSILPAILICEFLLAAYKFGAAMAARYALSDFFGIFLQISVYYAALLLLLPLLRGRISSRACALLWLIPNYLYIAQASFMRTKPRLIIALPERTAKAIFCVWLLGFCAVIIFYIAQHLIFRRKILKSASPIRDEAALTVFRRETEKAGMKKTKLVPVLSEAVVTPLSIGLFSHTTRLVLPRRNYSERELELIFRHELVHIGRADAWTKAFMLFCTAMCWFNPLMWLAMRRSADDAELSCDETVLLDEDASARREYATLLLSEAGDERGFTTCLSASARAMSFRLEQLLRPVKMRSGALVVGAAALILFMSCGSAVLACGAGSGAQAVYRGEAAEGFRLVDVSVPDDSFDTKYVIADEKAFHEYISGLELYTLTGGEFDGEMICMLQTSEGAMVLKLTDKTLGITRLYGEQLLTETYYVKSGIDLEYLSEILIPMPAADIRLETADGGSTREISALLLRVRRLDDGQKEPVYDSETPEAEAHGLFSEQRYAAAEIEFSRRPESCTVSAAPLNSGKGESADISINSAFELELCDYPARYTLCAVFSGDGGESYQAEFRFDIGDID